MSVLAGFGVVELFQRLGVERHVGALARLVGRIDFVAAAFDLDLTDTVAVRLKLGLKGGLWAAIWPWARSCIFLPRAQGRQRRRRAPRGRRGTSSSWVSKVSFGTPPGRSPRTQGADFRASVRLNCGLQITDRQCPPEARRYANTRPLFPADRPLPDHAEASGMQLRLGHAVCSGANTWRNNPTREKTLGLHYRRVSKPHR